MTPHHWFWVGGLVLVFGTVALTLWRAWWY